MATLFLSVRYKHFQYETLLGTKPILCIPTFRSDFRSELVLWFLSSVSLICFLSQRLLKDSRPLKVSLLPPYSSISTQLLLLLPSPSFPPTPFSSSSSLPLLSFYFSFSPLSPAKISFLSFLWICCGRNDGIRSLVHHLKIQLYCLYLTLGTGISEQRGHSLQCDY